MPPVTKSLSPAELAKMEHAFATDPASEAYKPLAEAYLGMGRFMEAMVVCKKGVKAHPSLPDPRVLLARVYAEQGKDKKALEELQGALQVAPTDKIALRLLGALQIKGGETAAGKEALLKAFASDEADPESIELMEKHGVAVPKAAVVAAPPPAPVAAPPQAPAVSQPALTARAAPAVQAQVQPPPSSPAVAASPEKTSSRQTPAARRPVVPHDDEQEVSGVRPARAQSGKSKAVFFLLLFIVIVIGPAYWGLGQYRGKLIREANVAISDATKLVKSDTFKGYEEAIAKAQFALDLNASADTTRNARGLLAYAYTIRWGEHIHEESNREAAEKNIAAGIAGKEQSAYLHAAQAMFDFYSGKTEEGLKAIEGRIKFAETNKKQVSIYYLTRGTLQMNSGDLEAAKESLDRAQAIAQDDPRVYIALGNLHRRRGNDGQALSAFNVALDRTRKTHPEGLLGTANLILDQENPGNGYCIAANYVKALQGMADAAAPRQLATNNFVRALLVSRVARDIPLYTDKAFQKTLEECTQVKPDEAAVRKEVASAENNGLSLDRNNPELLLIRGRRLAYEGKFDEAAAEIRKAIERNTKASHFHVELAKVLMKKEGGEPAAEEALKKALSLVPNSPKLLSMLGQVQYRQKKMDAARETLDKAVADPKTRNPEARFLLGKIYRDEKKDLGRAIELLKKAGEEYFSDPALASQAFDELAAAFELKGDKDSARATYEKSLNADKDNAAPYCHYARLLAKDAREREQAKALAQAFLKLAPKDPCAEEMQRLSSGG